MPARYPFIQFVILLQVFMLFSCQDKKTSAVKQVPSLADTAGQHTARPAVVTVPEYTQFFFDKKGNVTDSFPHGTSYIRFLNIGKKQDFPYGFAALQQPLNDSLHRICEVECTMCTEYVYTGDSIYCKTTDPILEYMRPTPGNSYFDQINLTDYYFFLARVDSVFLSVDDTEYGLLHFMKLKTLNEKRAFTVKVVKEDHVNLCEVEKISWKQAVPVYIIENNKVSVTSFRTWSEVWDCGEKADYAPNYAQVDIDPVKGIFKSYPEFREPPQMVTDPLYVFAFLVLDETKNTLREIKASSYSMQLVQTSGKVCKGTGLDLDHDQHADVFWYNRIYDVGMGTLNRNTVLYLKQHGRWIPVYLHHWSVFY